MAGDAEGLRKAVAKDGERTQRGAAVEGSDADLGKAFGQRESGELVASGKGKGCVYSFHSFIMALFMLSASKRQSFCN